MGNNARVRECSFSRSFVWQRERLSEKCLHICESVLKTMKKCKGFGARRPSVELPTQQASPVDVQTQDTQVLKLKKISQVVDIDSPATASSQRRDEHQSIKASAAVKELVDTNNARLWKNPLRGRTSCQRSSNSDIHLSSSSSSLSDASLATTSGSSEHHIRGAIVVAFDANARDAVVSVVSAVAWAFQHVVRGGDLLALLGVMDYLRGPLGYKCQVNDQTWLGANVEHLQEELALKKLAWCATPGLQRLCEERGVRVVVSVKAAARLEGVIVQDAEELGAVHVVLDRSLKTHIPRKQKYYLQHLSCNVTRMRRGSGVEILRSKMPTPSTSRTAVAAIKTNSNDDDDELFTIDHCVAMMPTHPHHRHGHGNEEGYESDDLFSICDVDGAWRTSSCVS